MSYEFTDDGIRIDDELLTWDKILRENAKIKLKNSVLLKFDFRYGRDYLYYYIISDRNEWEDIKEQLKKYNITETYLGEVCGKHSEVYFSLTEDSITEITDIDQIIDFNLSYGTYTRNCDVDIIGSFSDRIYEETHA